MKPITLAIALAAALSGCAGSSPYVGQEAREIKSLSARDIRGLLEGEGMGLARAAELNGYPGPMHVLELAQALELTPAQRAATVALMQRHKAEARALGAKLVAAERRLDQAFAEKTVDRATVEDRTSEIARLQGAVRASHLTTHLEQTALLTPEQVQRYAVLRGYRAAP